LIANLQERLDASAASVTRAAPRNTKVTTTAAAPLGILKSALPARSFPEGNGPTRPLASFPRLQVFRLLGRLQRQVTSAFALARDACGRPGACRRLRPPLA
jgi:hypothetical protein